MLHIAGLWNREKVVYEQRYTFAGCLKTRVMWSNFSGEHEVLKLTWKPLASTLVRVLNKL